jgi:hypothetical protein
MKIKFDRKLAIRIAFILLILAVLPAMPEMVIFLDAAMIDVFIALAALSFAANWSFIKASSSRLEESLADTLQELTKLYMFKPRVYCFHAISSSIFVFITGSLILSTLLWLPVMAMSSGAFGGFV